MLESNLWGVNPHSPPLLDTVVNASYHAYFLSFLLPLEDCALNTSRKWCRHQRVQSLYQFTTEKGSMRSIEELHLEVTRKYFLLLMYKFLNARMEQYIEDGEKIIDKQKP